MKKFNSALWILVISVMGFLFLSTVFAADIPIELYVSNEVSLELFGDWAGGLGFSSVDEPTQDTLTYWDADFNADYFNFTDDTAIDGFHVLLTVSDFVYDDRLPDQPDIPAGNMDVVASYVNGQPGTPTKGFDDPIKNASVLDNSCQTAQLSNYFFHNDFEDAQKEYKLAGSNLATVIFRSDLDCLNIGHLRLARLEATVPANSKMGNYVANLTFTIVDGLP